MNLIEIYRIKNWYYYLGFIIIGFLLNSSINLKMIIPLFLGSFLLAYAYSFNDFYDERKKAYFILPLILSIFCLPSLNLSQVLLSVLFLIIVTAYSSRPIRLKAKPFLSSLCNGFGFSILFLIGCCANGFSVSAFSFYLLFFCFNMVAQFIHEVVDLEEDRRNKITTTVLFLGEEDMKKLSYLFLFLSLCISLYLFYVKVLYLLSFLGTVIFIIFFITEIRMKKINVRMRKMYRNLGIIVGLIYLFSFITGI